MRPTMFLLAIKIRDPDEWRQRMSWTDERVEQLKQLWGQGMSASEIADTLGDVTRNAVIGKAHRLGLEARPHWQSTLA